MRRILVDRARQKANLKSGRMRGEPDISVLAPSEVTADERLLLIDESLGRLEEQHPESARIVIQPFRFPHQGTRGSR